MYFNLINAAACVQSFALLHYHPDESYIWLFAIRLATSTSRCLWLMEVYCKLASHNFYLEKVHVVNVQIHLLNMCRYFLANRQAKEETRKVCRLSDCVLLITVSTLDECWFVHVQNTHNMIIIIKQSTYSFIFCFSYLQLQQEKENSYSVSKWVALVSWKTWRNNSFCE